MRLLRLLLCVLLMSTLALAQGQGTGGGPSGGSGGGGTTTNAVTFNNGGSGAASGATFDGSSAVTVSTNTIDALPAKGATSVGTGASNVVTFPGSVVVGTTVSAPVGIFGSPSSGAQAALPSGAHGAAFDESSTAGVPAANMDYIRADATSHRLKQSLNNGAEVNIPIPSEIPAAQVAANLANSTSTGVIGTLPVANGGTGQTTLTPTLNVANGALALATSSISTGACQTVSAGSVNSAAATGVATTDVIQFTPNGSIKAITGYVPATTGGLTIAAYPTAGYVNFDVCNWTSGAITPGALTINWKVTR